jgi:hypothetical protein
MQPTDNKARVMVRAFIKRIVWQVLGDGGRNDEKEISPAVLFWHLCLLHGRFDQCFGFDSSF